MKTRLIFSTIALAIAGWCNATNYPTLTLYADGCEKANTIRCETGQQVNVSAIPSWEKRHFVRWTDGNTDNPRLVKVTKDMTLTAVFATDQYTITSDVNDVERGSVSGGTTTEYNNVVTLTATANYGYHFERWADGNTDNPRTIQVTEDKTYTAVFEKNTYTIIAQPANKAQGSVSAPTQAEYLDQVSLTVTAQYGYYFTKWTDGNTDNPRHIIVTSDTTLMAEFALQNYTVSATCDPQQGLVTGGGTFQYLSLVSLTATPNKGYEFTPWSDGTIVNPYSFFVEKDVTIEALFEPTTAIENVTENHTPRKVIRNGQVLILRDGKTYTTTGVEVR